MPAAFLVFITIDGSLQDMEGLPCHYASREWIESYKDNSNSGALIQIVLYYQKVTKKQNTIQCIALHSSFLLLSMILQDMEGLPCRYKWEKLKE
jgi:hypothetical protein